MGKESKEDYEEQMELSNSVKYLFGIGL